MKEFEWAFKEDVHHDINTILRFRQFIENKIKQLIILISSFRQNYITSYEIVNSLYYSHMKKRSSFRGMIEINDYFSMINYFPKSPYEIFCQPPDIKLPNIVNLEDKIKPTLDYFNKIEQHAENNYQKSLAEVSQDRWSYLEQTLPNQH